MWDGNNMRVDEIIALYESWDNRWDRQLLEKYKIINMIKIVTNKLVKRRNDIVQKVNGRAWLHNIESAGRYEMERREPLGY